MSRSGNRPEARPDSQPVLKWQKIHHSRNSNDSVRGRIISVDALKWKEVPLPDRMEDAEGFFGLEEIDDVEVVPDEDGKAVRFRSIVKAGTESEEIVNPASVDDDEWLGFDDEENDKGKDKTAKKVAAATKGSANSAKLQPKKEKPGKGGSDKQGLHSNLHFNVLEEAKEESNIDVTAWRPLRLSPRMLAAIASLGFAQPTPIQTAAIPQIQDGHDVVGKAVTGSGKTLAFGIPILERWIDAASQPASPDETHSPIALILAPTRELAHQLTSHLGNLGKGLGDGPRIATVTGGLSILKQQRQIEHADIIIGTPGRLWEIISESHGLVDRLKRIRFLVVDEADRLLSEGHFKELESILDALDRQVIEDDEKEEEIVRQEVSRQTLVFSATFHKGLQQKLAGKTKPHGGDLLSNKQSMEYLLKKLAFREARPVFVDSNPDSQMAAALKESIVECGAMEKDVYLYALILQHPMSKILVFANSISSVRRLTPLLANLEIAAVALHSGMIQKARLRSLERFAAPAPALRSSSSVLVATDVAARGRDVQGVDVIIHYHAPRAADMYVHRSGRTARADKAGKSVLLCSPDEVAAVTRLISKIHGGGGVGGGGDPSSPAAVVVPEHSFVDRNVIARLAPRVALSKKLSDATLATARQGTQDDWLRTAAAELGVDYDSDTFAAEGARQSRGRGAGKAKKQKQQKQQQHQGGGDWDGDGDGVGGASGSSSKAELAAWRRQLKDLLQRRVNLGVSERYLAGGRVDVDALLLNTGAGSQVFLG